MATLAPKTPASLFIVHRLIRIYPIYWLVLFGFFLLDRAFGHGFALDPLAVALLPGGPRDYALGVEWTLPFELSFYLVIFFVILARLVRFLPGIAVCWGAAIIGFAYFHPELRQGQFPPLPALLVSTWTLPFVVGLLVPFVVRRRAFKLWALVAGIGVVIIAETAPDFGLYLLSLGCFLLVAWAVSPRPLAEDSDKLPLLTKFGDWSYALYLCHVPVMVLAYRKSPAFINNIALFLFVLAAALLAASLLGAIDVGMYRFLKTRADQWRPAVRWSLGAAFAAAMILYAAYGAATPANNRTDVGSIDLTAPAKSESRAGVRHSV